MENAEQGKQERVNRCIEKLNKILEEEQCILEASITINGERGITSRVLVFGKDIEAEKPAEGGNN